MALASQPAIHSAATIVPDSQTADANTSEIGKRVKYFGDYELLEEIATGGMGIIWKARQTSLKRDVAIKMIRSGALAGPDEVARFLREAEAAANLQHPNIVAVHEVGEHDGQHYFSMDYVAGRDLGTIVKDGPLLPQTAARYMKIIAEAVHFAHQRGTLHRDLKPQNVLIDGNDQPRITDFGLAKIMTDDSRMTQSGVVMGSPSYMSPEQAGGRHGDIGPASDVYSLGAMLYELVTGRPPFVGTTPMDTLLKVMEADPTAPRRLKADIPPDLETICLKCLEKRPLTRYPSARALAEDLDRFRKGEPILARPASTVRKAVSWTRRHPGVLAAVAALAIVLLAFSAFYLLEENAFLRAKQADPALGRVLGPRHQAVEAWRLISMLAFWAGVYVLLMARAQAYGLPFKAVLDPRKVLTSSTQPLGEWTRLIVFIAGLGLIGCGIITLAAAIRAHVWEGASIWQQMTGIYLPLWIGLTILGLFIRDYRLVHYGPPSYAIPPGRILTEQQMEPIRQALEDFDFKAATKRFREAVPDAGPWEARHYVIRIYYALQAKDPAKFLPPPLSLAALNWNSMLICVLIEAIVLGALWFVIPPTHPVSTVSQFAWTFLLGMGAMAGLRINGIWKRVLACTPGLAAMVLSAAIAPPVAAVWVYLLGFLGGALLMISGFNAGARLLSER
jgi:hypothetical protein